MRGRMLPSISLVLGLAAGTAGATTAPDPERPDRREAGAVVTVRVGDAAVQQRLSQGAEWSRFQARHGTWNAMWNEATGTPHRAIGPSIPLNGFSNDEAGVDRAVRAFIAENPGVFGGPGVELETLKATFAGGRWYVHYRQRVRGVPVLFSDWEFRVGPNGRLTMFGADARAVPSDIDDSGALPSAVIREAAKAGLDFNSATDRVEGGRQRYLVPVERASGGTELRLVVASTVITRKPHDSYVTLVDARSGDVVWRTSQRRDVIDGIVKAPVHPTTPIDALLSRPLSNALLNATVGPTTTSAPTDTFGNYGVEPPGDPATVTSAMSGPYVTVNRNDGTNAFFSKANVHSSDSLDVIWTTGNSRDAERDAFYHINLVREWIRAIDPAYHITQTDSSVIAYVNDNSGDECGSHWEPSTNSITFDLDGATCRNMGTVPDLIWHEYAHAITFKLYFQELQAMGLTNKSLSEGLADALAALVGNDPIIGNNVYFTGSPNYFRTVAVASRWPEDSTLSEHSNGLIVASALWDLRNATSTAVASRLMHFAQYGIPDDGNPGVAMSEFFIEVIEADDDDNNLGNGTPHMAQIIAAFNAHGIGTNFWSNAASNLFFFRIVHDPIPDQSTTGPFQVLATITHSGPYGAFGSATLYYSVNDGAYTSLAMTNPGNPEEYYNYIPAVQPFGIVRYYIVVTDSYGAWVKFPAASPTQDVYQFIAGPVTVLIQNDMETNPGWTVGFAGDAATSGIWERGSTYGTVAQPYEDHSPSGTQCWVTGNYPSTPEDFPGVDDIDGGKTTLVTNTFNAAVPGYVYPIISYWRWHSNNYFDNADQDPWRVFISNNNGSTWTLIQNTLARTRGWQREVFFVHRYLTPTSTMKMRFVAQDTIGPSLVESAVDDWSLIALDEVLDVPAPQAKAELSVTSAWPNPFRAATRVRFTLPTEGPVEIGVYDLQGRKLRSLIDADRPAGEQSVEWDGRDASGRPAPSGPYYIRVKRADQVVALGVVLLR